MATSSNQVRTSAFHVENVGFKSPRRYQLFKHMKLFGQSIELGEVAYCDMGTDHIQLVKDAKADREKLGFNVAESAVVCCRCLKAIRLVPE